MSERTHRGDRGPRGPRHRHGGHRDPEQRRQDFLDAAVDAIRREGPAVSMDSLARAAGVTKPILYRVFGARDGLLSALADRWTAELDEVLAPLVAAGDSDGRDLLGGTIAAYLELVERDPALYRFLTDRLAGTSVRPIASLIDDVARRVAVVVGDRLRRAGADSGAAEPWAYALVGMVHQAGDWWIGRQTMSRQALTEHLVALAWDGLAAPERAAVAEPEQ
jgi:AcrR family transcriptional regulator